MKEISLNKGTLQLPETWDELSYEDKIYAFRLLQQVSNKQLDPIRFRLLMLQRLTGYKPQSGFAFFLLKCLGGFIAIPFVALYSRLFIKKYRREVWRQQWSEKYKPTLRDRKQINTNLFLLSEKLDFAFTIEVQIIKVNNHFAKNPVPQIVVSGETITGRKFDKDISAFTNISGREYSDCFDLYVAYNQALDESTKQKCLDRIISILYPFREDYNENLVSGYVEHIASLDPAIKFGILLWFSGIVDFYTTHPVYSILYQMGGQSLEEVDKINLGMNSVLLMTTERGYNPNGTITLNNLFDAQIEILKKNLSDALSKGAKIEDIANKTGLSVIQIMKLT